MTLPLAGYPRSCPVSGGRARFAVPGSWSLSQPSRLACLETGHLLGNVIKGDEHTGINHETRLSLSYPAREGRPPGV